MKFRLGILFVCLFGCAEENPIETEPSQVPAETTGNNCTAVPPVLEDLSECAPKSTDYLPQANGSQDDSWASCISDAGAYTQLELSVSSIQRVAGFDSIAEILWRRDTVASPQDFLQARDIYTLEQGLRTRVMRRFDPHQEAPPGGELSCGDEETYLNYPEYCIGPSTLGPIITNAFIDGIEGKAPLQNAARIEAGLTWFLYVSVVKEAHTCVQTPKDCDSSWAYYTGGTQRSDSLGLASIIGSLSPETHNRAFDGILALRCWRDLDAETPAENLELWQLAIDQLDQALLHGISLILRQKSLLVDCSTGDFADANREFLRITGPLLGALMENYPPGLSTAWESSEFDSNVVNGLLEESFACP